MFNTHNNGTLSVQKQARQEKAGFHTPRYTYVRNLRNIVRGGLCAVDDFPFLQRA